MGKSGKKKAKNLAPGLAVDRKGEDDAKGDAAVSIFYEHGPAIEAKPGDFGDKTYNTFSVQIVEKVKATPQNVTVEDVPDAGNGK